MATILFFQNPDFANFMANDFPGIIADKAPFILMVAIFVLAIKAVTVLVPRYVEAIQPEIRRNERIDKFLDLHDIK